MPYFVLNGKLNHEAIVDIFGKNVLNQLMTSDIEITDSYIMKNILHEHACPIKLIANGYIELVDINKIKYKRTFSTVVFNNPELMDDYVYDDAIVKIDEYKYI
jgi:hypothetical protein